MVKLTEVHEICKDRAVLLEKLREWQLIPTNYNCPTCGNSMKLIETTDRQDGWRWQCEAKVSIRKQAAQNCHTRVEFRTGTLFARSKLSIFQVFNEFLIFLIFLLRFSDSVTFGLAATS